MSTPDISNLASAADVFAPTHTLPQIRAIHKTIHAQLDEKSSRLRSQVGGSYRELLGTADAIVRMREENDEVQGVLGGLGARCGRAVVWGKVNGMANFLGGGKEEEEEEEGKGRTGGVARLQLLEKCVLAVSRVLRGAGAGGGLEGLSNGDKLVLATKLLIIARLLIKSLGDRTEDEATRAALQTAEKNRVTLRRKLSRCVERVLERLGDESDRGNILKALAAYSLATNSGARDSLKHFLSAREKAMKLALEVDENKRDLTTKDVLAALNVYTKTLLDVQAIAPSNLCDVLGNLKKRPLLADVTLQKLEVLRLDIYERWCGEDVQEFTPFIRHDDLDGAQAKEMLTAWADAGREVLIAGLEKTLGTMSEFKNIVELRTEVLQLWIRDGTRARGFDPSQMLDKLRQAVNARLLSVIDTKVNKLHLVGSEVAATLSSWHEGTTDAQQPLWDDSTYDMEMSNGVAAFLQEVMTRMYGRNDAVSKAIHCYGSWKHVIDDVEGVVEVLRKQRWDDDIDDYEEDEVIEARQEALSREDPAALQERLNTTLEKAFKDLEKQLTALWKERQGGPNSGRMAMFFIRVLRDIRSSLPKMESLKDFGLEMVPSLHADVAREVSVAPLDEFVGGPLARKTVVGRALWEGSPELPSSLTPGMFLFLRDLSKSMGDAGMDLWSPAAVKVIKGLVSGKICEAWKEALEALPETSGEPENGKKGGEEGEGDEAKDNADADADAGDKDEGGARGETKGGDEGDAGDKDEEEETKVEAAGGDESKDGDTASDERRDLLVQWFYDITYFQCCFAPPDGSKEWQDLAEAVYEKTGLDDDALKQRLVKGSQEYWKKTSLLFGLLS